MIPHRMLSNEILDNDLKDRVTACRKRLRLNRIHRAHFDNQVEELFETANGVSEFCSHSEHDPTLRESLVNVRDCETSQRVDEQEVGRK